MVADNVLSHAETLGAYSAARQADPTLSSVTVPLDRGLELRRACVPDLGLSLTRTIRPSSIRSQCVCWHYRGKEVVRLE